MDSTTIKLVMLTEFKPLMDNLQSITYHTFEQDPVKYQKYEEVRGHQELFLRCMAEAPSGNIPCTNGLAQFRSHVRVPIVFLAKYN